MKKKIRKQVDAAVLTAIIAVKAGPTVVRELVSEVWKRTKENYAKAESGRK